MGRVIVVKITNNQRKKNVQTDLNLFVFSGESKEHTIGTKQCSNRFKLFQGGIWVYLGRFFGVQIMKTMEKQTLKPV